MAIITLARKPFSGARELAEKISKQLGYRLVSREDVIEKTAQYGLSADRIGDARRRNLGWFPRVDLEWMHYVVFVQAVLSKEIQDGNLVYLGNNGQHLLQKFPHLLKIGVFADRDFRIENLIKRNEYSINKKTAVEMIYKIDKARSSWGKTIFNDGRHDPSEFDLVINTEITSIAEACENIIATVEWPEFQTTPDSLETIELMTYAAELRARIAMEPEIVDDKIEVRVRDGSISIAGSVHSAEDVQAVIGLLDEPLGT